MRRPAPRRAVIFFVSTRGNDHAMSWFLATDGSDLARVLVPIWYDDLLAAPALPTATYCFSDLEMLADEPRERAGAVWERLDAQGCRMLNHPIRTLRRYDLLRTLHARGINRFDAYRADGDVLPRRFPVFLRRENDHLGRRSELLRDPNELRQAVANPRDADERIEHSIIVEFCDTADVAGIYRKYAAFVLGDQVIARHLMFSTDWQVKEATLIRDDLLAEEREFVASNPHEAQLRDIFTLAGVEYGRIDYSVLDGVLQVWEINTNPTIVIPSFSGSSPRAAIREQFVAQVRAAWERIDAPR